MAQPKILGNQIDQSTLDANNFLPSQTGNNGKVLSTNGSAISWQTASGGASFPIGTIISGPTAPTDGGTWLECNGSSVSQSTYSSLFSAIGHDYLKYKLEAGTLPSSATANSPLVYDGTAWLTINTASTTVSKSTDYGANWSTVTALPGTLTSPRALTDENGKILFFGTASATAYHTANQGSSWTTVTLPTTSTVWQMGYNGSNWVAVRGTSTAVYYSTDSGITWNTSANALPAAFASGGRIFWNGSAWVVTTETGATSTQMRYSTSSTANGSGTWSAFTTATTGVSFNSSNIIVRSGSSTVRDMSTSRILISSDSGATTAFIKGPSPAVSYTYNGLHIIGISVTQNICITLNSNASTTSLTGLNQTYRNGTSSITFPSVIINQSGWADFQNYKMLVYTTTNLTGSGANIFSLLAPDINTTTNFNIPSPVNNYQQWAKSWIKAL